MPLICPGNGLTQQGLQLIIKTGGSHGGTVQVW